MSDDNQRASTSTCATSRAPTAPTPFSVPPLLRHQYALYQTQCPSATTLAPPAMRLRAPTLLSTTETDGSSPSFPGESAADTASRERVEMWAAKLFQNSPMIRFMTRHLRLVGCDPYEQVDLSNPDNVPRLGIEICRENGKAGGFVFDTEQGQKYNNAGITICANHMISKKHLEDTLAHEMIHWWDHCRFKVDWRNIRHQACSEIRAASLSGDCTYNMETTRSAKNVFKIIKHHQACVRRRAVLSLTGTGTAKTQEEAERVVDEVWDNCFKDTRPFDEIY